MPYIEIALRKTHFVKVSPERLNIFFVSPPPWSSVPRLPNRHLSGESTSAVCANPDAFRASIVRLIFFLRTLPARDRATGTGRATPQRSALLGVNKAINFQVVW